MAKAKELRPFAEKLVTMSKRETLHARRLVLRHIKDPKVVTKLFDSLSARYAQRPGGYTRIIKLGPRRGDNAEMAILELLGSEDSAAAEITEEKGKKAAKKATSRKKATKKAAPEKDEPKAKAKKTATKKKAGAKSAGTKSTKKAASKKRTTSGKKTAKSGAKD